MSPDGHQEEGVDPLLSIAEIVKRFDVSRQTIHRQRARGLFPDPEPVSGSTRLRWRESKIAAWIAANPKRPGARTDLQKNEESDSAGD